MILQRSIIKMCRHCLALKIQRENLTIYGGYGVLRYSFFWVKVTVDHQILSSSQNSTKIYRFPLQRRRLLSFSFKIISKWNIFPETLVLTDVRHEQVPRITGSFADVFCGTYSGRQVAVIRIRVHSIYSGNGVQVVRKAGVL